MPLFATGLRLLRPGAAANRAENEPNWPGGASAAATGGAHLDAPGRAGAGPRRGREHRPGRGRPWDRPGLALGPTLDPDGSAARGGHRPGPLLIIAGPGTGKTRTLTHRIAHQIVDSGLPAGEFLAITFTRRAAGDAGPAGRAVPGPWPARGTTFHGLGLRILREQHAAAGLPEEFGVADEAAGSAVGRADRIRPGRSPSARRAGRDPGGRLALRQELLARDLVDFDSLVEMSAARWSAIPASRPSCAPAGRGSAWTSTRTSTPSQYDLLRLISGDGAGLTAIGDPDQSIYGFRGADVGIFGGSRRTSPVPRRWS